MLIWGRKNSWSINNNDYDFFAPIWALYYIVFLLILDSHIGAKIIINSSKLVKSENSIFFLFCTEINIEGVVTKHFLARQIDFNEHSKKFSWKIDKLFWGTHLFEICLFLVGFYKICLFTTHLKLFRCRKSKIGHKGCLQNLHIFHLIYTCWGSRLTPKSEKSKIYVKGAKMTIEWIFQ